MDDLATQLTTSVWNALGGDPSQLSALRFDADGALPSIFAVTDLASAAIATAALAIAELIERRGAAPPLVRVDRRLASFWFRSSLRPHWAGRCPVHGIRSPATIRPTTVGFACTPTRRIIARPPNRCSPRTPTGKRSPPPSRAGRAPISNARSSTPAAVPPRCTRRRNGARIRRDARSRPNRSSTTPRPTPDRRRSGHSTPLDRSPESACST